MGFSQGTQLGREGEGHHKIVNWQEFCLLAFEPLMRGVMLALPAGAVTTGDWPIARPITLVTLQSDLAILTGAAAQHGV